MPETFLDNRESKNILHVSRGSDQGPGGALKTVFFNMAMVLERIDLEA